MQFERTQDLEQVRSILTHPRVYPHIGDDFAPAIADFQPNPDSRIVYLLVRDGESVLGLLMFFPSSLVLWEGHIALLPSGCGRAVEALAGGFRWMWRNTTAAVLTGTIPVSNVLACRAVRRAGMQESGRIPQSFVRGGQLIDQMIFTISRATNAITLH
jgi:RimJ/RimL family protein N-acetyltransferase